MGIGGEVGVGVGVGVGVTEGVGVGSGDGSGVAVGVATGVGGLTATPLFQTSFEPDFMQVNFLPPAVDVAPTFVHLRPALGVAAWTGTERVTSSITASPKHPLRSMSKE